MNSQAAGRNLALHIMLAVVGIISLYAVSSGLRKHISLLLRHMVASGSWAVKGASESIDQRLHATYDGRENEWRVSYVGGGANLFDLSDSSRAETIRALGKSTIADADVARTVPSGLTAAYESLLDLAKNDSAVDQRRLAMARINLSTFRQPHLYELEPYDVQTSSAKEVSLAPLKSNETPFEQSARCRAEVIPLGAKPAMLRNYSATVTLTPRLREEVLARPWLDETILDQASGSKASRVRDMFIRKSSLNLVPKILWILLPEEVEIEFDSLDQANSVASLHTQGRCCTVVCETQSFDVDPSTLSPKGELGLTGTRGGLPPILYAIVSQRRDPRGRQDDQ